MDKDIERLGSVRLKRQRVRRRIAELVVSLAFIVLGATVYGLIQPASAEDKDKTEFTVQKETSNYTNLAKISKAPDFELESNSGAAWNGENFDISVALDFEVSREEVEAADYNFYYVFSEGVYITDKLCEKWYEKHDDNGVYAFSYHFIKTDEGKYAVLIKFDKDYVKDDIAAGIKFNCKVDATIKEGGDLEIKIGGEAIIEVDDQDVEWGKDTSKNYDIHVEKLSNTNNQVLTDNNGRKYVDYTLKISSQKGTPDVIKLVDTLEGQGLIVDVNNPSISLKKNGSKDISSSKYKATVTDKGNYKYELNAELPKLGAGEYYELTYRYYLDDSRLNNGDARQIDNRVKVSSENSKTHENVIDTSSCYVKYHKSTVAKRGEYRDGKIYWTIDVNSNNDNIAGKVLKDDAFAQAQEFTISSDTDKNGSGYWISRNSRNEIESINFIPTGNNSNTNKYTITYCTVVDKGYTNKQVKNTVDFDGDKTTAEVTVPGEGNVSKTLIGQQNDEANTKYTLSWKSVIEVPENGLPAGTVIKDELITTLNTEDHFMTYEQVEAAFNQIKRNLGDNSIGELQVKVPGGYASWTSVNKDSFNKYFGFKFTLLRDIPRSERAYLEMYYDSEGTYGSGVDTTYRNTVWAGDVSASAEFKRDSNVQKTDEKGNQGTSSKIGDDEGTVTWKVKIRLDGESDKYVITDSLPKEVTLKSLGIEMGWDNGKRYEIPSFDGQVYTVDDYGKYWETAGIKVSAEKTYVDGAAVIKTTVQNNGNSNIWNSNSDPNSRYMYLTYVCTIDGYKEADNGTVYTLKNRVKVSTNRIDNYGDSWQTQIVTKPGDGESGEQEEEHGNDILTKDYVWYNSDKRLNYTVKINPEGKDLVEGNDLLNFTDTLTYANVTDTGSNTETWDVHLIPTSVALYEMVTLEDGSVTTGAKVTDWQWTYTENKNPNQWQNQFSNNVIEGVVPDGKALILKYSYTVNLVSVASNTWGKTHISIKNEVDLKGIAKKDVNTEEKDYYTEEGTSAYIYRANSYNFYKVDQDNYGKQLEGAEFTVYRYEPEQGKYVKHKSYKTDDKGTFSVVYSINDYDYNHQYYIVETKAPDGYELPNDPQKYYFYFGADKVDSYPTVAEDGKLQGTNLVTQGPAIEFVENKKAPTTSISVYKYWQDAEGKNFAKTNGKITLQIKQVDLNGKATPYGQLIEVTPDENGDWHVDIDNLPKYYLDDVGHITSHCYRYLVEEVGIDDKYNTSGYIASYVYIDQDGKGYVIKDGVQTTQGIVGGTVQITNKYVAYRMPETGGTGNRWLFLLSGALLAAFAAISLIYRVNKTRSIN